MKFDSRCFLTSFSVAAALGLAGCVTSERQASTLVIPTSWQHDTIGRKPLDCEALSKWWEKFNDESLNCLIQTSFECNTDLRTALAKIEESRARRGVTRSALLPSLNSGFTPQVNWSRDKRNRTAGNSGETSSESYSGDIDASWEIDLFGKLQQDLLASDADLAGTKENLNAARVSLAAEVADAYVTLRAAEARLEIFRRNVETIKKTADMTSWKEQAGEGTALDTQQAKTNLEQSRASIPSLLQTIEQTRNRLVLLAGLTPGSLDQLLEKKSGIPHPPTSLATGIPCDILRQRPDIRSAEWALVAAVARTKSANRERLPSLNLSGSVGFQALSFSTIFSPEIATARALGQLTAPIFNGGQILASIDLQVAQEKQALIAWEGSVLTALSEVEDALIAVRRTSERLDILKVALASAREAARLSLLNFEAGQVDLLDVLVAQRTLLSVEESYAISQGDYVSAYILLYKSLGGGWSCCAEDPPCVEQ